MNTIMNTTESIYCMTSSQKLELMTEMSNFLKNFISYDNKYGNKNDPEAILEHIDLIFAFNHIVDKICDTKRIKPEYSISRAINELDRGVHMLDEISRKQDDNHCTGMGPVKDHLGTARVILLESVERR